MTLVIHDLFGDKVQFGQYDCFNQDSNAVFFNDFSLLNFNYPLKIWYNFSRIMYTIKKKKKIRYKQLLLFNNIRM
jgi:hypothetical protein